MTVNREAVEEAKVAIRRKRAADRARQVTNVVAELEIAVEDLAQQDPRDPILKVALGLLQGENPEEALYALADALGEEKFRELMLELVGQQPPGRQPQQLVLPERIDVYNENGQSEGWSIWSQDADARRRIEGNGYELVPQGGVMVYKKRRAIAPPAPAGSDDTRQQPAAGHAVGHAGRRRWAGSRSPR